jgi:bifunctional non-homologous end joining protein LigD
MASTSKLSTYRAKRDFNKTAEPSGKLPVKTSRQLRFVIQKHAATRLHFDLRLELDGVFKSWAVTRGPSLDPADKRLAVEVEDHPLDYGDFEGTIPKGQYGGGTVQLWDRGYWQPEGQVSPEEQLRKGDFKFVLDGERLHGSYVLVRMKGDRFGGKRTNWLLIKHRDEFAKTNGETDAMMAEDRSVASDRNMADIAAGKGKGPKPFMLETKKNAQPDAVWNSKGGMAETSALAKAAAVEKSAPARKKTLKKTRRKGSAVPPEFIDPELCKLVDRPPTAGGWGHEIKLDGYRMQLRIHDGQATLKTRTSLDWSERFPEIVAAAASFPDAILDGEVVALNKSGVSNFSALQNALSDGATGDLVFFVFDMLFAEGNDLRALPLRERKQLLRTFLGEQKQSRKELIRYIDHVEANGAAVLESASKLHLEGIISKRLDSTYESGRSADWVKTKVRPGDEVVIGGWTQQSGQLRSLLVGVHRGDHLVYVGRVGTGFTREIAAALARKLNTVAADDSPFGGDNAPRHERDIRWVRPELVAEIEFAGWTDGGNVRQAAFKGLREDKPAAQVKANKPVAAAKAKVAQPLAKTGARKSSPAKSTRSKSTAAASPPAAVKNRDTGRGKSSGKSSDPTIVLGVSVSSPDKPLWQHANDGDPVTKLDLAHYYETVAEWLLPHIKGRPCSIIRLPDGMGGEQFFQRHAMQGTSKMLTLQRVSGDREPYLQIDRIEGLIAVAQTAAMELHPWNCQPDMPDVPGRLVFDLDPAPELGFDAVITAAKEIRERLEALGLITFCKTTGGKGLHVVTPLAYSKKSKLDWPQAKAFAAAVCSQMAEESPERYVVNMSKKVRTGRIFLDYLRNDRMSTAVAPYSPRARDGAPVSMPILWNQVKNSLDPKRYTLRTVPGLLSKSNAWEEYRDSERPLEPAIRKLVDSAEKSRSAPKTRAKRSRKRETSTAHAG